MIQVEYLPIVLTGIGIIVSILYYASVLRNQNRTRQAQLFMQIYQELISPENFRISNELVRWEWDDYDDFMRKYGAENNPEAFSKRYSTWFRLNGIGLLVKDGLIDVDRVYELMNDYILWQWKKFGDLIIRTRVHFNNPDWMEGFEYVAGEMERLKLSRGYTTEAAESFGRYVPKGEDSI
jgi:hypothetical protein